MIDVQDLATRFDLKRQSNSWRGRCPACGYADTFIVRQGRDGRPLFWCASCEDRQGLIATVLNASHGTAYPLDRHGDKADVDLKRRRALGLWRGSTVVAGTLAERYLRRRGLEQLLGSSALRFRGDTPHPGGGRLPALVAVVLDVTGDPIAVHRTYLDRNTGAKADIEPAKASYAPFKGGAIRLSPAAPELVIGEGIETAASAGILLGLPAWAAISAGNLARSLMLPPEVRSVVIAVDFDEGGQGQRAAREAWWRWTAEGRTVRTATPNTMGDFNDLLLAGRLNHE